MVVRDATATQPWFNALLDTSISSKKELEIFI